MESRWVYREVERIHFIDHVACQPDEYPHSEITRRLVRNVAETKDLIDIRIADYIAKAAWASGPASENAVKSANDSARKAFSALPYIQRGKEADKSSNISKGEALMQKFIKMRQAEMKKPKKAVENTKSTK